jgi:biotin carboxyl carrier protein
MKPNQTMKKCVEIALFPMEVMTVTQLPNNDFSHKGRKSIDLGGRDGGIDKVYAPFSGTILKVIHSQGAVYLASDAPVLCADGKTRLLTAVFIHDDLIQVRVGQKIEQGQHFFDEGRAGRATGNHVHVDISEGRHTVYADILKNSLLPQDIFYINDTIIRRDGGLAWKTYSDIQVKEPITITYTVKDGDTLDKIAKYYNTTWQKLYEINKKTIGNNPNTIKRGQILTIE